MMRFLSNHRMAWAVFLRLLLPALIILALAIAALWAAEPTPRAASRQAATRVPITAAPSPEEPRGETAADRGYRNLITRPYLPPDFDQEVFDSLWKSWEEPLRAEAEKATPARRREMAYERYGFTARPGDPQRRPQQYVVDAAGNWTMNCLACHQGQVAGRVIAGAPNTRYALQTLTDDVRSTKLALGKPLSRMELGSIFIPLGGSNGTTNAVMFGVVLLAYRDADLNIRKDIPQPDLTHHDHDAPAWWTLKKKKSMYSDGFAAKGHRALMQFILVKENGPEKFRQWEREFADIQGWIDSLEPPKYPGRIDAELATLGKKVFDTSCADCHGTYGPNGRFPSKIVPIAEVGTDRVRLDALSVAHRKHYAESWFTRFGRDKCTNDPGGYVAPPLDGIWASAPYFHNGSVPTLWHVLHPEERPKIWTRTAEGYDTKRIGLEITEHDSIPGGLPSAVRRTYFDTSIRGKSAAGHDFPNALSEEDKTAVLEYLKTL